MSRFITAVLVACVISSPALAGKPAAPACATIPGGTLLTGTGEPLDAGYDGWGYNYQAQMFNGGYCDSYRDAAWCQAYEDVALMQKWNDAWLSNEDCDGDRLLDRHFGIPSYVDSGAWLTNHQRGTYADVDGSTCTWSWFLKVAAVTSDDLAVGGYWYDDDGEEIGQQIWGDFAIVQSVYNDPCAGLSGLEYHSEVNSGLGYYAHVNE